MTTEEPQPGCEARCPGCAHRTLSARESAARKRAWLQHQLAPWRHRFAPLQAVTPAQRWGYRDRVCLSSAWDGKAWRFGLLYRDELVAIPRCPVHSTRVRTVAALLAGALPPEPGFPLVFYVQAGAQATLVLKTSRQPQADWLDRGLAERLEAARLEGLWLNLYPAAGRHLFAKRGWRLLWGQPRSVDRHGLRYGPAAFQQLLPGLHDRALNEAEAFLAPSAGDSVVDLYCGRGSGLVRWVGRSARTLGIELGGEAVECARHNAPGALVLRGACRERLTQLRTWAHESNPASGALLYANPPRTGIEPEVLDWIGTVYRPTRMAYLSCSAGTLRRDLEILTDAGYEVERLTPYDFFPQTYHVETLALLRRVHWTRSPVVR
jgi:tRNA/tmRNA/rRNA uracil-C5-methylase (TrmA/RlmC/RlmD family)